MTDVDIVRQFARDLCGSATDARLTSLLTAPKQPLPYLVHLASAIIMSPRADIPDAKAGAHDFATRMSSNDKTYFSHKVELAMALASQNEDAPGRDDGIRYLKSFLAGDARDQTKTMVRNDIKKLSPRAWAAVLAA